MSNLTILSIWNLHTAADHISGKDKTKYLSHQQINLIATAMKSCHLQTSGELIRNVQDSQSKNFFAMLVRKERKKINKILLEGVTVDNTIGSLAALLDAIWLGDAVK